MPDESPTQGKTRYISSWWDHLMVLTTRVCHRYLRSERADRQQRTNLSKHDNPLEQLVDEARTGDDAAGTQIKPDRSSLP